MSGMLGQIMGAKGGNMIQKSDKNIGMQYANAGLQAPQLNVMGMLQGLQQQQTGQGQQGYGARNLPTFLNMLRGGQ